MRYPLVLSVLVVVCLLPAWALTAEQEAKLLSADGAEGDEFGASVVLDGDTALIGAPGDDDYGNFSGAAYVFRLYDDDVPTVGGFGLVLLLMAVLGTGVYFMRGQATG
jgi:hypothetical protein